MKGIYLAAYKAYHPNYDIVYQDILGNRDIGGDMMDIILSKDLGNYDFIIATPPCNYWSRANYRRETSEYAQKTKHLLIDTIKELVTCGIPFIIENVRNDKMFKKYGLFDYPCYIYKVGRHTYWSNILFYTGDIDQIPLTDYKDGKKRWLSSQNLPRSKRQGGEEVHQVIERFLETLRKEIYD